MKWEISWTQIWCECHAPSWRNMKMMKMTIDFSACMHIMLLSAWISIFISHVLKHIFLALQKGYTTFDDNKIYTLYITNSCRMSQSIFTSISINYDRWSPCCCPFHPIHIYILFFTASSIFLLNGLSQVSNQEGKKLYSTTIVLDRFNMYRSIAEWEFIIRCLMDLFLAWKVFLSRSTKVFWYILQVM